jgi:hypothetical protein
MRPRLLTLILISAIVIVTGLSSGCSSKQVVTSAPDSFFAQIAAEPAKYNGQTVTFSGFWFQGFEIAVIAEHLEPQTSRPGNVEPEGILIWVKGRLPAEAEAQLYPQPNNPTGYPAHYGKVEITGTFEYGSKYGHMDAYHYQLTVVNAKLLDWKPTFK